MAGRARTVIRIEILKNAMFGPAQFYVYVFAHSIEEMLFRGLRWIAGRKNGLKTLVRSNIYSFRSSSFAIYVHSNRPVKLRSLPHLDPRTGIRLTSAGFDCRSKCCTRLISYWLLTKTSLDPMEY